MLTIISEYEHNFFLIDVSICCEPENDALDPNGRRIQNFFVFNGVPGTQRSSTSHRHPARR